MKHRDIIEKMTLEEKCAYLSGKNAWDTRSFTSIGVDVLDKLGWYLAFACAGIAQIVDPEVFVIGGGVSKAGDIIIKAITKYYNGFAMDAVKNKEFRLATLGNDAGIYGCAAMIAGKKIGYEK